jgi:hypothetical protein
MPLSSRSQLGTRDATGNQFGYEFRSATSSEIRKRAEAKIADIEGKIRSLDSMRESLVKLVRSCDDCTPLSECPILESLDRGDE